MSFGGPLLKKKVSTKKVSISQVHLFSQLEPILRTLGYISPNESLIDITSPNLPPAIPINIKKEVFKSNVAPQPSQRN